MQDEQGLGKDLPSMASASLSNPAATPTGLSKRLSQSYIRHARMIRHSAKNREPIDYYLWRTMAPSLSSSVALSLGLAHEPMLNILTANL